MPRRRKHEKWRHEATGPEMMSAFALLYARGMPALQYEWPQKTLSKHFRRAENDIGGVMADCKRHITAILIGKRGGELTVSMMLTS